MPLADFRTGKYNEQIQKSHQELNKYRGGVCSCSTYVCTFAYLVFCLNNSTVLQGTNSRRHNLGSHGVGSRLMIYKATFTITRLDSEVSVQNKEKERD